MCRPLWKLAKENNRLPAFLFLEGVCCENQEAVSYGGYADIYRGKHRGVDVALKRLRLFSMLEGQGKVNAELVRPTDFRCFKLSAEHQASGILQRGTSVARAGS